MKASSSFTDWRAACDVLSAWRQAGRSSAQRVLSILQSEGASGILLSELELRLAAAPGPRLLVDGLWLSRPFGGITRVWRQIFDTWLLPGFLNPDAPIALINRNCDINFTSQLECLDGLCVDPLDPVQISDSAEENGRLVRGWGASAFCSTWISSTSSTAPACPELALVHDCIPERFGSRIPSLLPLRRRWWNFASSHVTVSSSTAQDLHRLLGFEPSTTLVSFGPHPFTKQSHYFQSLPQWRHIVNQASLPEPFFSFLHLVLSVLTRTPSCSQRPWITPV